MKVIKVRAWDIKGNQYWGTTEGDWKIELHDGHSPQLLIFDYECEQGSWIEIEDVVFEEFTGVHDKNSAEIYEGDITRANDGEVRVICYDIHQAKYKAVPQYAYQHNAGKGGWTGYDLRNDKRHEIIGNIYENPELLEVHEC